MTDSSLVSVADADWFQSQRLRTVLAVLNSDQAEARIVGGAVRNSLIGRPVGDIDIATTLLPADVIARGETAGMKAIPTGIGHGTITLVHEGEAFEVTTLRKDVESDGRHAVVAFGLDWQTDARRRDLTINALYADADGNVIDLVGGLADIETQMVRFIGEPIERIEEDYLRILRFFRFFAWYGKGRPDAAGLKACVQAKDGLATLSAERVWMELKKMLAAPDPGRALLWMRQTGVLSRVLPETEKWGIDSVPALIASEAAFGWTVDPMLRLMAIIPPMQERIEALSLRLKLSRADTQRLISWADLPPPEAETGEWGLRRLLYYADRKAMIDRLKLSLVSARGRAEANDQAMHEAAQFSRLLKIAETWKRPEFPLGGEDLIALGIKPGPSLGALQKILEKIWVESDFTLAKPDLLDRATAEISQM